MELRFGRLKLRITFFFAAFLVLALSSSSPLRAAAFFLSAFLHEAGHLVCLLSAGCRDLTLSLLPGGAAIAGREIDRLPPKKALVSILAGPVVNLVLSAALFFCGRLFSLPTGEGVLLNLTLGLLNLLPLSFLDGGRALAVLLILHGKAAFLSRGQRRLDLALTAGLFLSSGVFTLAGANALFLWGFAVYAAFRLFRLPGRFFRRA